MLENTSPWNPIIPSPCTPLEKMYVVDRADSGVFASGGASSTFHPCYLVIISAYSESLESVTIKYTGSPL